MKLDARDTEIIKTYIKSIAKFFENNNCASDVRIATSTGITEVFKLDVCIKYCTSKNMLIEKDGLYFRNDDMPIK